MCILTNIPYPCMVIPANDNTMVTSRFMQEHLPNSIFHFGWSFVSGLGTVAKISNIASIFHDFHCDTLTPFIGQVKPQLFQLVQPSFGKNPFFTKFLQGCDKPRKLLQLIVRFHPIPAWLKIKVKVKIFDKYYKKIRIIRCLRYILH